MAQGEDGGQIDAGDEALLDAAGATPKLRRVGPGAFDLTQGPITKTLLLFTLPTLAANILQSLNGSINAIWVGHFLGDAALAATANANIIMFLLFSMIFGFGMAANVIVGQSMGRGDILAARKAFGSSVGFCLILSLVLAVAGWVLAPRILDLLATPGDAYDLALAYLRVIFVSMPGGLLTIMLMMGLRGGGDAMTPLKFMILTVILDTGLNPFLILGIGPFPEMGIAGSATATALANYLSLAAMVAYVYARDLPLRLRGAEWKFLKPDGHELRIIISRGLPMGAQMIVMSLAMMIIQGLVNLEGVQTAAAYAAAQQLWNYVQMPAMAVGGAISSMAAQNIGAGRWDRVEHATRSGLLINFAMTGLLVLILLAFDRPVLALFLNGEGPAMDIARHMQFLASWSFIFFGMSMVFFGTIRANGIVIFPLVILVVSLFGVRLGFYFTFYGMLGADALWWSFSVSSCFSLVAAWVYYRFSKWREAELLVPGGGRGVARAR
ncbi:MAG TPA: MATE family efflux transporter [Sphingobium sp.]|nr:MATE family efflux transporter [Sphingobium sp.]